MPRRPPNAFPSLMKRLFAIGFVTAALFTHAGLSRAQWQQTSGPKGPGTPAGWDPMFASAEGSNLPSIELNGRLFAGTPMGLFSSTDTGNTWSEIDTGFASIGMATAGNSLFSIGDSRPGWNYEELYCSTNEGQTWNRIDTAMKFFSLSAASGDLFTTTTGGKLYRSSNQGATWDSILNSVGYIYVTSDKVFALSGSGEYYTTNLGNSWNSLTVGGQIFYDIATSGSSILVGSDGGDYAYFSTDDGANWNQTHGIPFSIGGYDWSTNTVGNVSLAAFFGPNSEDSATLYRSTDSGSSWNIAAPSVGNLQIANFLKVEGKVFAMTSDGLFESTDTGLHWKLSIFDEVPLNVYGLVTVGGKIIAGTGGNGRNTRARDQQTVPAPGSGGTGLFVTTNDGSTWNQSGLAYRKVFCLLSSSTYLFAGTDRGTADTEGGIFRSSDTGASWTRVANGFTNVNALGVSGSNLFAGTDSGIYLSTNNGTNWKAVFQHVHVNALATQGSKVFAGTSANGLIVSTNNGTSWSASNGTLPISDVQSLAVKGGILFAGTNGNGLFLSKDTGISWTDVSSGLPASSITALEENSAQFFAGTAGGGIYRTDDSGATWAQVDSALTDPNITSLAIRNGNLFAGTLGGGVWERPLSQMLVAAPASVNQPTVNMQNISAYPNPFSQSTTIAFTTDAAGYADVSIVNLLGVEVAHLFFGELAAGNHSFTWDASKIAAPRGMYECLVRMNGRVETVPMVLAR